MAGAGNSINEGTTGICGFTGTAFTGSAVSQYTVQVGGATSSTLTSLGTGSAGQVLQSGGNAANPSYSTPTYPSASGSSGTILRSDGTNNVYTTATYPATTTVNQILYSSSANVIGGITAVIDGVMISDHAAGVPSFLANGTAGFCLTANSGAPPSWQAIPGGGNLTYTSVNNAASPYTVLSTDQFIGVDVTGGAVTVKLPNAPSTGRVIRIKNTAGDPSPVGSSPISVTTVGGTVTIEGVTTYTINVKLVSISLIFDGSNYRIF